MKQLLIPGMIFENMGITYLGPVDGHNLMDLVRILREAKKLTVRWLYMCRRKKAVDINLQRNIRIGFMVQDLLIFQVDSHW